MATTHSPLRYPGGKSSLAPFLRQFVEDNSLLGGIYAEPFAGGAGAALTLLFSEIVSHILINDADKGVYAFWKLITEQPDFLIRKINTTPVDLHTWRECKEIIENNDIEDITQTGFAFFFLNRCNHSGIISANPIGGIHQTGKWKIDARFNKKLLVEKISRIEKYAARITVSNMDAIAFIEYACTKNNVCLFIDPPYYKMGKNLYMNYYLSQDHKKLAEKLKLCTAPWIMTYDKVEEISNLYDWCYLADFSLNYFAQRYRKGEELLIAPKFVRLPTYLYPQYGLKGQHKASCNTLPQAAL